MIIGRARELERIVDIAVHPQGGRAALITGPPGGGKTALLAAAISAGRAGEGRLLIGSFDASSGPRPLGFLNRALRHAGADAQELLESIGAAQAAGRLNPLVVPPDLVDDVLGWLEIEGASEGALFVVDDLHYASASSIALISAMVRRLGDLGLSLIMASRSEALDANVGPLAAELAMHDHDLLPLPPLEPGEVRELVRRRFGAPPDAALEGRCASANGNPLLVEEMLGAMERAGALRVVDGALTCTAAEVPTTIPSLTLRRIVDVPPATASVLRIAAVLGTSFRVDRLAAATEMGVARTATLLQPALDRGVLRAADDELEFAHDLIRDALYDALAPGVREALHRDIAERLHAAGAEPETVAAHIVRGARSAGPEAVPRLIELARDYASRSPNAAAVLFEHARSLCTDPDQRDRLAVDLAPLLLVLGRQSDAERICREVLAEVHDPALDRTLVLTLARATFARGEPHEGVTILRRASEADGLDDRMRVRFLGEGAFNAIAAGLLAEGIEMADRALAIDAVTPDELGGVAALCARSVAYGFSGRFAEGLEACEQAVARARRTPGWEAEQFMPGWFYANALLNMDRLDEGRTAIRRTAEYVRHWSMGWSRPVMAMAESWVNWYQGRLADGAAEAEAGLALAAESGVTIGTCMNRCVLTVVQLAQNDVAAARESLDLAMAVAAGGSTMFGVDWLPWLQAIVAEAEGNGRQGAPIAVAGWRQLHAIGDYWPLRLMAPDAVRLCLSVGDTEAARSITDDMREIAAAMGSASAEAAWRRCAAMVDRDLEQAQAAVAAAERSNRVVELAEACEEAATIALEHGSRDLAVELFTRSARLGAESGARRIEAKATQGLRRAGQRSGAKGSRYRPESGWESLTPTELKVAELVADGLQNQRIAERLFISRYTVETHLKHIFAKLSVTSRAQLAGIAARQSSA